MAELVGIVASAGSIIKAIGSVVVLINGISNANHEARQLTGHLDATKQILTALTATLSTVPQSSEFLDVWSGSAKTVLTNVKSLVSQLETKLDAKSSQQNRVRLSTWKKMKWPFVKEEYLELQQMLGAYIMMLAMVQNAFMQGTTRAAQETAKGVDETMTTIGPLTATWSQAGTGPPSEAPPGLLSGALPHRQSGALPGRPQGALSGRPLAGLPRSLPEYQPEYQPASRPASIWLDSNSTIIPSDSVSQIVQIRTSSPTSYISENPASLAEIPPQTPQPLVLGYIKIEQLSLEGKTKFETSYKKLWEHPNMHEKLPWTLRDGRSVRPKYTGLYITELGPGKLQFSVPYRDPRLQLEFLPEGIERFASYWYIPAENFPTLANLPVNHNDRRYKIKIKDAKLDIPARNPDPDGKDMLSEVENLEVSVLAATIVPWNNLMTRALKAIEEIKNEKALEEQRRIERQQREQALAEQTRINLERRQQAKAEQDRIDRIKLQQRDAAIKSAERMSGSRMSPARMSSVRMSSARMSAVSRPQTGGGQVQCATQ